MSPRPPEGPGAPTDPLVVEDVEMATVMPVTPEPRPTRPTAMRMGVFDEQGQIVRRSLLWRSYGRMGFPADLQPPARTIDRAAIYAGHLPRHFGHFILEGLSRLWFARHHPELPIVWACPATEPPLTYAGWQRQLLDVVGITNESLFVNEPTRFSLVHVPHVGYRIKDRIAAQQAAFLGVYPARPRDPALRVWLSRAGLPPEHESVHAQRLDVLVAAGGWQVVRPELLSIVDQLELLATASRVAGEEGSALHLMALLSDVRGLRVDVICRRPDRPAAEQNQNYQTIATAKGIEQRLHVIPEEHVLAATYGHVRKVATTLAGHLEALDIARTPGTADTGAERLAATLVAELAADRRVGSLLDLGSSGGGRILRARDGTKVDVVREAFARDPRHLADGIGRYEMPPTEFLELAGSLQLRYDVIVIEGPWGAGELVELWIRSQAVATDDAAWVLRGADDAATQEAAMLAAERRLAGSAALAERAGRSWLLAGETGRD